MNVDCTLIYGNKSLGFRYKHIKDYFLKYSLDGVEKESNVIWFTNRQIDTLRKYSIIKGKGEKVYLDIFYNEKLDKAIDYYQQSDE